VSGIKDIVAKSLGSSNPLNQVHATFQALAELRNRQATLEARGAAV
jgi:small subunit ribosomal protein S5